MRKVLLLSEELLDLIMADNRVSFKGDGKSTRVQNLVETRVYTAKDKLTLVYTALNGRSMSEISTERCVLLEVSTEADRKIELVKLTFIYTNVLGYSAIRSAARMYSYDPVCVIGNTQKEMAAAIVGFLGCNEAADRYVKSLTDGGIS